jgi:beta-lactamase class A
VKVDADTLREFARAADLGPAAVYVGSSRPGDPVAALDAGTTIYPASMIKVPIAVAVAADVERGRLAWSTPVAVTPANLTVNDAPSPLCDGASASVAELVELMLARSDNVATNVLIELAGRERMTAALAAIGFPGTAVRRKLSGALPLIDDPAATGRNAHPARESFTLLRRIAAGTIPGAARIAGALGAQYWNSKLSTGLAAGDRFAHKTGDTDEVSHDGGILTLERGARWVIVVYTTLPANSQTDERFGTFMRALRPLLSLG